MGLFKRLRRSPEEKAWGAIRELEKTLNARDADSKRSPGRLKGSSTAKMGQDDPWEQWRPRLMQAGFGLALVFAALMAVNYLTGRFHTPEAGENMDQRTFDALWGASRPTDDTPAVVDEPTAETDDTPPPAADDASGKSGPKSKQKPASEL